MGRPWSSGGDRLMSCWVAPHLAPRESPMEVQSVRDVSRVRADGSLSGSRVRTRGRAVATPHTASAGRRDRRVRLSMVAALPGEGEVVQTPRTGPLGGADLQRAPVSPSHLRLLRCWTLLGQTWGKVPGEHRFRSSFRRPKGRVCGSLASCAASGIDFPGTAGCTGVAVKDCSQTSGLDVLRRQSSSGGHVT